MNSNANFSGGNFTRAQFIPLGLEINSPDTSNALDPATSSIVGSHAPQAPSIALGSFSSESSPLLLHFPQLEKAVKSALNNTVLHPNISEVWPMGAPTWSSPTVGLGMVTGTASLLLAFLSMRLRHLSRHLRHQERQVEALSLADPLTGLANRKRLDQVGNRLLAEQPEAEISLLYISLDRFKSVNDELGYSAGDELLCALSRRLQTCIEPHHTLARIGADEFVILLNAETALNSRQMAQRVLSVFHQPFYIQGQPIKLSGSLGIAQTNDLSTSAGGSAGISAGISADSSARIQAIAPTKSQGKAKAAPQAHSFQKQPADFRISKPTQFSQLLIQADIAMSKAKLAQTAGQPFYDPKQASSSGSQGQCDQSHYAIFHPFMQVEVRSHAKLQRALAQALQRQELCVHYQPIVNLRNAQPVGFEALVRWQHPQQGLLVPGDFLPLAEEMGLTIAIDRQVMQAACRQLLMWQRQFSAIRPSLRPSLSVNLAGAHLTAPDLVDYIQRLLKRYPIQPQQLNVEVTESVMIADPDRAIDMLCQIKALGVSVSLDDFGTGYSSLCYLHQLPVDVLKIDRFFVNALRSYDGLSDGLSGGLSDSFEDGGLNDRLKDDGLKHGLKHKDNDGENRVILASIVELAAKLKIRVVAEGIECYEQLHQLKQMHCAYGQGNFFSKPVSAAGAQALLCSAQPWLR